MRLSVIIKADKKLKFYMKKGLRLGEKLNEGMDGSMY